MQTNTPPTVGDQRNDSKAIIVAHAHSSCSRFLGGQFTWQRNRIGVRFNDCSLLQVDGKRVDDRELV